VKVLSNHDLIILKNLLRHWRIVFSVIRRSLPVECNRHFAIHLATTTKPTDTSANT